MVELRLVPATLRMMILFTILSLAYRPEAFWGRPAGHLETNSHSLSWNVGFRDGSAAEVEVSQTRESLDRGFRVGDVAIPAGRYRFTEGALGYSSPTGRAVQAGGELSGGDTSEGIASASPSRSGGIRGRTSRSAPRTSTTGSACRTGSTT